MAAELACMNDAVTCSPPEFAMRTSSVLAFKNQPVHGWALGRGSLPLLLAGSVMCVALPLGGQRLAVRESLPRMRFGKEPGRPRRAVAQIAEGISSFTSSMVFGAGPIGDGNHVTSPLPGKLA